MSLVEDLKHLEPKLKPQGCKTCLWLEDQDATDDTIRNWARSGFSHTQLHRVFVRHGYDLSLTSLKNHLNRCYGSAI